MIKMHPINIQQTSTLFPTKDRLVTFYKHINGNTLHLVT